MQSKMFNVSVLVPTLLLILSITYGFALQVKIQSVKTCKFFDATEEFVKLENAKNSDVQKWELQARGDTGYVIKNVASGYHLNVRYGCVNNTAMITFRPDINNYENELFYIGVDCTIRSACFPNLRLTVRDSLIVLAEYNAKDDNRFLLEVV